MRLLGRLVRFIIHSLYMCHKSVNTINSIIAIVIITSPPPPGGGCEVLFSPCLSVCLSVCVCLCVCVCPANILVFYLSVISIEEILI